MVNYEDGGGIGNFQNENFYGGDFSPMVAPASQERVRRVRVPSVVP